jgi:hypothetical protein
MNINAMIAVMSLRKWFASLMRTKTSPVHPARARTQKRRSRFLHHLEARLMGQAFLPETVVGPAAASLERGNIQTGREPIFFTISN